MNSNNDNEEPPKMSFTEAVKKSITYTLTDFAWRNPSVHHLIDQEEKERQEAMKVLSTIPIKKGRLIAFEGCDKAGKTTLIKYITGKHPDDDEFKVICFPNRETVGGKVLNAYLTDSEHPLNNEAAHLLFSFNRYEMKDKIQKYLDDGYTVLVDRYYISGIVYSRAKGVDREWSLLADLLLPKPDVIIYLKIDISTYKRRLNHSGKLLEFREKDFELTQRIMDEYELYFKEEEEEEGVTIITIDDSNGQSIEQIYREVIHKILE